MVNAYFWRVMGCVLGILKWTIYEKVKHVCHNSVSNTKLLQKTSFNYIIAILKITTPMSIQNNPQNLLNKTPHNITQQKVFHHPYPHHKNWQYFIPPQILTKWSQLLSYIKRERKVIIISWRLIYFDKLSFFFFFTQKPLPFCVHAINEWQCHNSYFLLLFFCWNITKRWRWKKERKIFQKNLFPFHFIDNVLGQSSNRKIKRSIDIQFVF